MAAKKKLKIQTQNKSYLIQDSPFYKLASKSRLSSLLMCSLSTLKKLSDNSLYKVFTDNSGRKSREIQQPVGRLDILHTRIASLLCRINPPEYLHSGIKGRTYISNAEAHVGQHKLITTDIRSFFPSTTQKHVFKYFHLVMKCSPDVADLLSRVATYNDYVPTGSRLSMPLAFWANFNLFETLHNLSVSNTNTMTVYVDDLTFSGPNANKKFMSLVSKIVRSYGHECHPNKTKVYRSDEVKVVTGVAINGDKIVVCNKNRKDIYQDQMLWILSNKQHIIKSLNERLLGRLNAQGQIDGRLKDKARTLRIAMNKNQ